jgi:fused signal recognition particle receptor
MSIERALEKTRGGFLARLLGRGDEKLTGEWLESLEESLLRADLSVSLVDPLMAQLRDLFASGEIKTVPKALAAVRETLVAALAGDLTLRGNGQKPRVILVVGVNGSGKTTTAAKLAKRLKDQGERPLLAAADTFRAAAIEQLKIWADRTGAAFMARAPGADAAGLAFDAVTAARERGIDVLLIDTAGRLQNRSDLMGELQKVVRVIKKVDDSAPHATLLVLDATVGQNALSQVEIFKKDIGVTGLAMTKFDGTARGGILVAIAEKFKMPVHYVGVGEAVDDLTPFSARDFARAIAGLPPASS